MGGPMRAGPQHQDLEELIMKARSPEHNGDSMKSMKLRRIGVQVALAAVAVFAGLMAGVGPAAADEGGKSTGPTLGQVVQATEQTVGKPVGPPTRAVVVDGVSGDLTPDQMNALLAGKNVGGMTVRLAVAQPSSDMTVGGLFGQAGVAGSTSARIVLSFRVGGLNVSLSLNVNCSTISVTVSTTTTDQNGNTTTTTTTTTHTVCTAA
jgi:hypothetical protein